MASFANYFTIMFLSILFLSCVCQTQARVDWNFFSKFSNPKVPSVKTPAQAPTSSISAVPAGEPTQAPISSVYGALTPAPAPVEEEPMSDDNYGLYGYENDQFPPAKEVNTAATTSLADMEDELLQEDDESFDETDTNNYHDNYENSNNGYTNNYYNTKKYNDPEKYANVPARNYNKNGYQANNGYINHQHDNYENSNNGYTNNNYYNTNKYSDPEKYSNVHARNYNKNGYQANRNDGYVAYNRNNGYVANDRKNGYEDMKQGMSDTRFMENGKYHYDVKSEDNFDGGYENTQKNSNNEHEEYFKDEKSPYEFDTMEEYEKQGENNGHVGVYWP